MRLDVRERLNHYTHDNTAMIVLFIIFSLFSNIIIIKVIMNSYFKITSFITNKVSERLHTQSEREEKKKKKRRPTPQSKIFPQEDYETSHDSQRETVMARQQGHKISSFLCKYIPASARSDLTLFFFPS